MIEPQSSIKSTYGYCTRDLSVNANGDFESTPIEGKHLG